MAKKTTPRGAEVLFTRLLKCEWREGVIYRELASGTHVEASSLTLRLAMQLHDVLGTLLTHRGEVSCIDCRRRRKQ